MLFGVREALHRTLLSAPPLDVASTADGPQKRYCVTNAPPVYNERLVMSTTLFVHSRGKTCVHFRWVRPHHSIRS